MESLLLPLLLVFLALPLILGARRQKKAVAEAQALQSSLVVGDKVTTTSGLHALVVDTDDADNIDLEIAPGVRTTWLRAAIRERITEPVEELEHDGAAQPEVAAPIEETRGTERR